MQRSNKLISFVSKNFASKWKPKMPDHKFIIEKDSYRFPHPIWNLKDAENVEITHYQPKTLGDTLAYYAMRILRTSFDKFSGYKPGQMNESTYIRRCIFLETIAGVPGFIGGILRHLNSLRGLRHDGGWIHHLLEEAENERMHLLTFLQIRQPGIIMRCLIMASQFFFISGYGFIYLVSPSTAHRFVGYLEEEAVKTYTQIIKDLDDGKLPLWEDLPAAKDAIRYWGLDENANFRDVIVSIRADEVSHREFNHHFADIPQDMPIAGHKLEVVEAKNKHKLWDKREFIVEKTDFNKGFNLKLNIPENNTSAAV